MCFLEISNYELMMINGGGFYEGLMSVAKFVTVAAVGVAVGVAVTAAAPVVIASVAVGSQSALVIGAVGGALGGLGADIAWNKTFDN